MNNFLKNMGVLIIVLGSLLLVVSNAAGWLDDNIPNLIALLLIIAGIFVHIIMNKKIQD